jgi:hypothetical protein
MCDTMDVSAPRRYRGPTRSPLAASRKTETTTSLIFFSFLRPMMSSWSARLVSNHRRKCVPRFSSCSSSTTLLAGKPTAAASSCLLRTLWVVTRGTSRPRPRSSAKQLAALLLRGAAASRTLLSSCMMRRIVRTAHLAAGSSRAPLAGSRRRRTAPRAYFRGPRESNHPA